MKTKNIITGISTIKYIYLTSWLLLASPLIFAQVRLPSNMDAFGIGNNVIGIGYGIGGNYTDVPAGTASSANYIITYDRGMFRNLGPGIISLGALVSYKTFTSNFGTPPTPTTPFYGYFQRWTYSVIGIRSAYHWNFTGNPKLDLYAGVMLSYYDLSYKFNSNDPYITNPGDYYYGFYSGTYNSYLNFSFYGGMKYYLSKHIALWAELNYAYTVLVAGISYKF